MLLGRVLGIGESSSCPNNETRYGKCLSLLEVGMVSLKARAELLVTITKRVELLVVLTAFPGTPGEST